MGVHGLTPFLKKSFPDALKHFTNRLEALRGKTIVVDGTLVTQRFHYTENHAPRQHVARWYNLMQELRRYEVNTICVFDGKERNAAKAGEAQRRRRAMELTRSRGSLEEERFQRLQSLNESLIQLKDAANQARTIIGEALQASATDASSKVLENEISARVLDEVEVERDTQREAEEDVPARTPVEGPGSEIEPEAEVATAKPQVNIKELTQQLHLLHLNFKATTAKLASLPSIEDSFDEGDTPKTMTKSQYELTHEEGELWKHVANAEETLGSTEYEITQQEADSLLNKSYAMASSFRRRNNTPTPATYIESKEILEALGVLVIDATGAVEAEALASALVLSGHADYVATEDTDVLVYGAPMVRNLTGHHDPLLIMSGSEVRDALKLDPAAYLDFMLLLGTDFTQRITGLGPVTALNLIKQHGSIEAILDAIADKDRYSLKLPREVYLAQVNIAREVFRTLPPLPAMDELKKPELDLERAKGILAKYEVERYAYEDVDPSQALSGNMFGEEPSLVLDHPPVIPVPGTVTG